MVLTQYDRPTSHSRVDQSRAEHNTSKQSSVKQRSAVQVLKREALQFLQFLLFSNINISDNRTIAEQLLNS